MSQLPSSPNYYSDKINLHDIESLEIRFHSLLQHPITSLAELESWLTDERKLIDEIKEAMTGHQIDFLRDTLNTDKRDTFLYDQNTVQPILTKYQAELNKKFFDCPFTKQLDDKRYGLLRRIRKTQVELFREDHTPLMSRELELDTKYREIMGGLTIEWDGDTKPYSYVKAQIDHPNRVIRKQAWMLLAQAHHQVKPEIDAIMDELVKIRHQMAINAEFPNYRDYHFVLKNREYNIQDCYDFHETVEKYVVPVSDRLNKLFQNQLGVTSYRPWDHGPCTLQGNPFSTVTELLDGVEKMMNQTDSYFHERFQFMRQNGLMDVEARSGKQQGAFCDHFLVTKNAFIFSNFSPSYIALIALIHEFGHAMNDYLQFENETGIQDHNYREEIAELYSHSMELLLMDKLDTFYKDEQEFKNAQRELLRRTLNMLINPIAGDLFQHWMYTHPNHTSEERDAKYLEINKRFLYHSVDTTGLEVQIGESWIGSIHFFAFPFYKIEYAMAMLGALQLLQIYREDPAKAISLFKQGAGTDLNQSIAQIYQSTGVQFDFSEKNLEKTARFVESLVAELQ